MIWQPGPESSLLLRAVASAALVLHIGGGSVGILSGATAMLARKGSPLHVTAGRVFVTSMMIMSGVGAMVAPQLPELSSSIAGAFTFYLVLTAWMTVRRSDAQPRGFELGAIAGALLVVAAGITLMRLGDLDGSKPDSAVYMFIVVASLAGLGDLRWLLRRTASAGQRLARHLWRMCFAMFIATGSLFLGQPKVFPQALRDAPGLRAIPVVLVLLMLVYWLLRNLLTRRRVPAPLAATAVLPPARLD